MNEEFNILVATRVMDWRWDDDWGCYIPPGQVAKPSEMWQRFRMDGESWEEPVKKNHIAGIVYNGTATRIIMPDWSRDIKEAWEVVERMRWLPWGEQDKGWSFEFMDWWTTARLYACTAEEAARAICEAALKIVGEECLRRNHFITFDSEEGV